LTDPLAGPAPPRPHDWRPDALRLAVELYARREEDDFTGADVLDCAAQFSRWLGQHPGRLDALSLAVDIYSRRTGFYTGWEVRRAADEFLLFLTLDPAVTLTVGDPVITSQADPTVTLPLTRTGADMAVTMTDGDQATYPAASETDSAGFPVTGDTITITEDSAGAVVALTQNPDGSAVFAAVAPGAAQVTWTDGTISFSDTINVTTGAVASLVVGAPVIAPKAAAGTGTPPVTPPAAGGTSN